MSTRHSRFAVSGAAGTIDPAMCHAPQLLVLGPVRLIGARGPAPSRSTGPCLEYCAWMLSHPDQTPAAMTRALLVAESTRRSNTSRLRLWLGTDDAGEPFLPDAYNGRIRLHKCVTSDWEWWHLILPGGPGRATPEALAGALGLVRGAPLADAPGGQWHWAESWRHEMVAAIREAGLVLAGLALEADDFDVARWATDQAFLAAPEDAGLMTVRIRAELAAGNRSEVARLALDVSRVARSTGRHLPDDLVALLQETTLPLMVV